MHLILFAWEINGSILWRILCLALLWKTNTLWSILCHANWAYLYLSVIYMDDRPILRTTVSMHQSEPILKWQAEACLPFSAPCLFSGESSTWMIALLEKTPFPIKSPVPRAGHNGPMLDILKTALCPGHSNPCVSSNLQFFKVKLKSKYKFQ